MRLILSVFISLLGLVAFAADCVTISGRVTDYDGRAVDSCNVMLYNPDFSVAYEAVSDSAGCYSIEGIAKGDYACVYAMRIKEYPRMQQVAPEDMRLEFWAWNVIADRNIRLDIRYDKLELYGTTAFYEYGGRGELLIYTRPMSVTKVLAYDNYQDKAMAEKECKVTVAPEYMDFEVYADGRQLKVMSVQPLSLTNSNGNVQNDDCYLLQTELPAELRRRPGKPCEIRVVGHNRQYDEWGESVYYLRPFSYRRGE